MQICLQSRKRSIKRIITLALLCAFATAIALYMLDLGNDTADTDVVLQNETAAVNDAEKSEKIGLYIGKMNNETQNNAKTYAPDSKSALADVPRRKDVTVLMKDKSVVNMDIEDYVMGCVYGEMPLSFCHEALMAQSIAVRSFTANKMQNGNIKHKNADVCTDYRCCQSYVYPDKDSMNPDSYRKLYECVNATRSAVMTYDGKVCEAVYHASSGESTLNSEDVWGERVEYLRSVKSPEGELAVSATGMGHRVGMSQHGANILGNDGMNCFEILCYYYNGVSFTFI